MALNDALKENQWKKGESGNPDGRPPTPPELKYKKVKNKHEYNLFLHKILSEPVEKVSRGGEYANQAKAGDKLSSVQALALKLVQMGLSGKIQHMNLLMNQIGVGVENKDDRRSPENPLAKYSVKTLRVVKETLEQDLGHNDGK